MITGSTSAFIFSQMRAGRPLPRMGDLVGNVLEEPPAQRHGDMAISISSAGSHSR